MDPKFDFANVCPACGRICGFRKQFCGDECFARWLEQDHRGFHFIAGWSLAPEIVWQTQTNQPR